MAGCLQAGSLFHGDLEGSQHGAFSSRNRFPKDWNGRERQGFGFYARRKEFPNALIWNLGFPAPENRFLTGPERFFGFWRNKMNNLAASSEGSRNRLLLRREGRGMDPDKKIQRNVMPGGAFSFRPERRRLKWRAIRERSLRQEGWRGGHEAPPP